MDKTLLNKLKIKTTGLASAALIRVELIAEEQKLKSRYQSLGQKLYTAVQGSLLETMKDDPRVVELVGAIEECQKKIEDLEKRLKENPADSEET